MRKKKEHSSRPIKFPRTLTYYERLREWEREEPKLYTSSRTHDGPLIKLGVLWVSRRATLRAMQLWWRLYVLKCIAVARISRAEYKPITFRSSWTSDRTRAGCEDRVEDNIFFYRCHLLMAMEVFWDISRVLLFYLANIWCNNLFLFQYFLYFAKFIQVQ